MIPVAFAALAFMGGRSTAEIRACEETRQLDTGIAIGVGCVVSAITIFLGQRLFWHSIPAAASAATAIALVLTLVYALFYRLLIRASEVAHWLGKAVLWALGFTLAGVNALLAGHELVMIPFADQVQEVVIFSANQKVGDLRSTTEDALGLGTLGSSAQSARQDEDSARTRLATIPTAVLELQKQAQACDTQAQRLQAALPEPDAPAYPTARAQWREQRSRCASAHNAAKQALAQHQTQAAKDLQQAQTRRQDADRQLGQARQQSQQTVDAASPTLHSSASSGFARHAALWKAVELGKVPAWAVWGLMAIALTFEGAGLLLKVFLPKDEASYARITDSRITATMGESELAYARDWHRQIKPAMQGQAAQMQADASRIVKTVLAPAMTTRFAADQFARAARSTKAAQRRTGQAATPVIEELTKVMPGMQGAAGFV